MHGSRVQRLVGGESGEGQVVIVRVQHRLPGDKVLSEILLVGDQPHQQEHPGPVKRLASPYRGVSFHSCTQRWRSRIKHGSKSEHLGYFTSDVEAACAYNQAAKKIHGVNAQQNEAVELIVSDSPAVSSVVLDTTRVVYDGVTEYVDKASKPRASPRHARPCMPTYGLPDDETENRPCNEIPVVPHVVSLAKLEQHETLQLSEWEDLFIQYWFQNDAQSQHYHEMSQPQHAAANAGPSSAPCLKRERSFVTMHEPKRIRC